MYYNIFYDFLHNGLLFFKYLLNTFMILLIQSMS